MSLWPQRVCASGALSVCLLSGCGSTSRAVPLLHAAGAPLTLTPNKSVPLEVVTRSTGVDDPLPVSGSSTSYSELESALGIAVSSAVAPWAFDHQAQRPGGWQVALDVTRAEASYKEDRLFITINARVTLRDRTSREYLAQSLVECRQAGLVPEDEGAPVIYSCMSRMGRDIAGWLGSVQP
ncbi:MAG TPA: hypothetical protein VF407_18875 [Polyangiaceae bacterium]